MLCYVKIAGALLSKGADNKMLWYLEEVIVDALVSRGADIYYEI